MTDHIDLTALRTLAEAERPRVRHGGVDEPSIHLPTATVLRLIDALEAVLVLHRHGACAECMDSWPCATVTAITTALGADDE